MNIQSLVHVQDVMSQKYVVMDGMLTIKEAIAKMREQKIGVIIVNKRHENDAYGILLLSDIAKQVLAKNRSPERVNIYEIMAKPVLPVSPDMDIRYCARLFDNFGLSVAPVIENEQILGLIGYRELVLYNQDHL